MGHRLQWHPPLLTGSTLCAGSLQRPFRVQRRGSSANLRHKPVYGPSHGGLGAVDDDEMLPKTRLPEIYHPPLPRRFPSPRDRISRPRRLRIPQRLRIPGPRHRGVAYQRRLVVPRQWLRRVAPESRLLRYDTNSQPEAAVALSKYTDTKSRHSTPRAETRASSSVDSIHPPPSIRRLNNAQQATPRLCHSHPPTLSSLPVTCSVKLTSRLKGVRQVLGHDSNNTRLLLACLATLLHLASLHLTSRP